MRRREVSGSQRKTIRFDDLIGADLIVDAVHEERGASNVGHDPIGKLLLVGNSGAFLHSVRDVRTWLNQDFRAMLG